MAIVCVPGSAPSSPHSMPQAVTAGQGATFMVPLRTAFPGATETVTLSFNLDGPIDLVFTAIGKTLTSQRPVDDKCVFTGTPFILTGTFKGTTFVDVRVDGAQSASIRVDVG